MKNMWFSFSLALFVMSGWVLQACVPTEPTREIMNVAGDLYRVTDDNHRTVFLVTSEGIILSDPISADFANWLKVELAERFDVPVRYVLYSHHHWDHASGAAAFAAIVGSGPRSVACALVVPRPISFRFFFCRK